ncbi:MAG: hypothetical protein M1831_002973 [Alyxoria varia]|nr:MAG: hypothetical protein M1831_002973 [Alyxoria varia]
MWTGRTIQISPHVDPRSMPPSAGWDDLAIGFAIAVNITYAALLSHAVSIGMGLHLYELGGPTTIPGHDAIKWNVITTAVSVFTFAIPKIGVALLLGRILGFMGASFGRQMLLYAPAILLNLWAIAVCAFWLRQCVRPNLIWEKPSPDDSLCTEHDIVSHVLLSYSCYSAFLDFAYAIFPMIFVLRLQMSLKKKLNISGMLGLGVIGGIAAIYKCVQLPVLAHPHNDVTWTTAPLLYCIAIEANVIVIAASTPTIGPFVRLLRSSISRTNADGTPRTPQSFSSFGTPRFLRKAFSNNPATRYKQFSEDSSADDNQRLKKEQAAFATSSLESGTTGQLASSAKQSPSIYKMDNAAARTRDIEGRGGLAPPPAAYIHPQPAASQNLPPVASKEGAGMEMKILGHDIPRSHSDNSDGERYGHHEGHMGGGRVIMH